MGQGTLLGFASQRERKEEKTVAEVGQKLHAAIQAVLDAPAPTEEKVCQAARSLGCRILALHFSPHVGVGGEIRGAKAVRFLYSAMWGNRPISGGNILKPSIQELFGAANKK